MINIKKQLEAWRSGMVSDGELLTNLIQVNIQLLDMFAELSLSLNEAEKIKADQRMKRIGVPPFSNKTS